MRTVNHYGNIQMREIICYTSKLKLIKTPKYKFPIKQSAFISRRHHVNAEIWSKHRLQLSNSSSWDEAHFNTSYQIALIANLFEYMFSWQGSIWRRVPPHTPIAAMWLYTSSYCCKSLLTNLCLKIVIFEFTSRIGIFNIPCKIAHRPVLKSLWWWVNIGLGNGLVPPGSKPLSEPKLNQIYVAIWRHFGPLWVK